MHEEVGNKPTMPHYRREKPLEDHIHPNFTYMTTTWVSVQGLSTNAPMWLRCESSNAHVLHERSGRAPWTLGDHVMLKSRLSTNWSGLSLATLHDTSCHSCTWIWSTLVLPKCTCPHSLLPHFTPHIHLIRTILITRTTDHNNLHCSSHQPIYLSQAHNSHHSTNISSLHPFIYLSRNISHPPHPNTLNPIQSRPLPGANSRTHNRLTKGVF